jgi:hypothetical protein
VYCSDSELEAFSDFCDSNLPEGELRPVVVIDRSSVLSDPLDSSLASAAKRNRLTLLGVVSIEEATRYASGWIAELKKSRKRLLLQPEDEMQVMDTFGFRYRWRPAVRFGPGRGLFMDGRSVSVVQAFWLEVVA